MRRRIWLSGLSVMMLALGLPLVLGAEGAKAESLKALIVDGQNAHDWKGTTPVLKRITEDTRLFTVDVATSRRRVQT